MSTKIEKIDNFLKVTIDEETKKEYDFEIGKSVFETDGVYVLRKSAIAELAMNENVIVGQPKVVFAQGGNYVLCRSAEYNGKTEYALGEANESNLATEIAKKYPAITADNRAYQRAILAVLGLAGKVYGDEEISLKNEGSSNKPTTAKPDAVQSTAPVKQQPTTAVSTSNPDKTNENTAPKTRTQSVGSFVTPEMIAQYPWLTNPEFDRFGDETKPDTYKVEQGRHKAKGWTAAEMLVNERTSAEWYASKPVTNTNINFSKCIIACRKAIYNELYRSTH